MNSNGRAGRRPTRGHLRDYRVMARITPLAPPEEVFLDWLMAVPGDADLQVAAQEEINRIDRRALRHPALDQLRTMLLAFARGPVRGTNHAGY